MRRTWTIIGVRDVHASFNWYQSLLGLPQTAPAHDDFGQILDSDETVLLCLHEWGAHDHSSLMSPDHAQPGNGLLLFIRVDDFDLALQRARSLVTRLEDEPQRVLCHHQCAVCGLATAADAVAAEPQAVGRKARKGST
jgi:hypothetical protein